MAAASGEDAGRGAGERGARLLAAAGASDEAAGERRARLFAAVGIPDEVRAAVDGAAAPLRQRAPGLRWTAAESWHLTVAFLGWTDPRLLAGVEEALARAAMAARPFPLALTGRAGAFGGARARVLWAGMRAAPQLADLAEQAQRGLAPLGFAFEQRPFRAHLTLARAPRGEVVPRGLAEVYEGPASSWTVTHLQLLRSHLSRGGARYEPIAKWPLGAAEPDA